VLYLATAETFGTAVSCAVISEGWGEEETQQNEEIHLGSGSLKKKDKFG
jgi:hypothetical protein